MSSTKTKQIMKAFLILFTVFSFCCTGLAAQTRVVTGTVKDNSKPLAGASVKVEGTTAGTQTDESGNFRISAAPKAVLIISSVGYETQRITLGDQLSYTVVLVEQATKLDDVVVTAMGISREKKSLGYASQSVSGADLNVVRTDNIANELSGKVSGVQVRRNTNMGGSTNIVIRGYSSLSGDNQALFVVDGVPVDNSNTNTRDNGFDFGNMAADINPDDVETVNVLKGAAATALYGSRAANGAIVITTKKGSKGGKSTITINSGIIFSTIDKSTFPTYQTQYGAGTGKVYGPNGNGYFNMSDVDGNGTMDLVAPYAATASFGAPFDPSLMVFQWNSVDPASPKYKQATPWVNGANGPITFFETPVTYNNNVSVEGSSEKGNYRVSYSNFSYKGLIPNSTLKRNNISVNSTYKLNDKLSVSTNINFINSKTKGRAEVGSGTSFTNYLATFRNYWQTNIDLAEVRDIYFLTRRDVTPFVGGTTDNPYYVAYETLESDTRNRFFGNVSLKYDILKWLNVEGRVSLDNYNYIQEDRRNNMIRVPARYSIYSSNYSEMNYDLMVNVRKNIGKDFNITGVAGINIRRNFLQSVFNTTNGGLIVDKLFSIANSKGVPPAAEEAYTKIGVDGYYGLVSLGYRNMLFLDLTGRADHSSTLPPDNSTYFYPSIATSFVFSELLNIDVISFGKLRLNYAQVGSSAPANSLTDILNKPTPFGTTQLYSVNPTKRNSALKPENTASIETGLEMYFFKRRLGIDISLYKTNTKDQIMPVAVSSASGYTSKYVNAGEIENKGIELTLTGSPLREADFGWDIAVNWALNKNKVIALEQGIENLQIGSFGAGVSLNARVGDPYGIWYGTDFIYVNGQREIDQTTGEYKRTTSTNNVIGNMNAEWNGGINNKLRYKNFNLSFLIDIQKGGDIFSNDMANGVRDGLYDNTVGLNDLGNPMRNSLADGGGIVLQGVDASGKPNTVRTRFDYIGHALGSNKAPQALFMYDASYVKLREVALSYNFPFRMIEKIKIKALQISLVGSNLWIIDKNMPYADPEAGLGAGNVTGYQVGVFPATKNYGFNVKIQF